MADRTHGRFSNGRHAGMMIPLFSIPSRNSWGIGEIPDLMPLARWFKSAGLGFVVLLPVNEMQDGQTSPYSALSAMALDPLFISIDAMDDWRANRKADALGPDGAALLQRVRNSPNVDYAAVRTLKTRALAEAFRFFDAEVWGTGDRRERQFLEFRDRERWWLDDFVLFRALHDTNSGRHWREWSPGVRDRDPSALDHARKTLDRSIRYYAYVQWIADEQWQRIRRDIAPIGIFGDFPFMVSGHSADVWARQDEFDLDSSVGTPPDAFSATGQDWGLPAYRWDVIAKSDYAWLRDRVRRSVELFDGFRIDHLIGFYRTFIRKPDGSAGFSPADEPEQRAQGERLLTVFEEGGATLIGEDLGTVPDFMRESLRSRWRRAARTIPRRWPTGGTTAARSSGGRSSRCRRSAIAASRPKNRSPIAFATCS
jgi:4-alpha-glucanotransferase